MTRRMILMAVLASVLLSACVTHVHPRYPTWQAYQQAHPNARFVVIHTRPSTGRTCWPAQRGWRCVVR